MAAPKGLAALPLVVLVATVTTLVVVKIRATRHASSIAHARATAANVGVASDGAPPGLGTTAPIGAGRVSADTCMMHEDPARTHRAAAIAPHAPRERWRVTLGGPIVAQVTTSPDASTVYAASLDGFLTAIDRRGVVRWRLALGDRAYAAPAVADDGTVFVGSDAKKLFAVTPAGAAKWTLEVDGELDTAPLVAKLARADADADGGDSGKDDARASIVFAAGSTVHVVTTSGQEKARFRARRKVFTAPAAGGGLVFFGSQDHHAYAIHPGGTLAWSVDLGADVDGGPAVTDDGDVVFGTDQGRVVRLRGATGAIAWSTDVGGFVRGALSIGRDGDVLAGVYGPTPGVVRLAPDGRVVGALRVSGTGSPDFGVHGGPLEDREGTLVFGAEDDRVYGVERSGGVRFTLERGADVDAPITLTRDGALIVAADDGTVAELGD